MGLRWEVLSTRHRMYENRKTCSSHWMPRKSSLYNFWQGDPESFLRDSDLVVWTLISEQIKSISARPRSAVSAPGFPVPQTGRQDESQNTNM